MKMTVKCIGCKAKKVLQEDQIPRGNDMPMCDKCFMPLLLVKVVVGAR